MLFFLSLILFVIAIRPTLTEIIKLPIRAASGEAGVGRDVTRKAMRRVWGELRASVCTVGVLALLTPNANAPASRLLGRRWPEVRRPGEHFTLYSVSGLAAALARHR